MLATALARWVGRPLRRLENAAEALGSGELGARAEPPKRPAEVRQVTERFNVMAARLETLIYDHRAVIADVSHQLRTPLAALRLRMELLAADAVPAAEPEFEGALEELARLSRLVDGLLAVARAENTSSAPALVALGSVLHERAEAWRPVAAERGVELSVRVHGDPVALLGPGHLEQVLDNLIDNALTAEPTNVALVATSGREGVRLSVVDDGSGNVPNRTWQRRSGAIEPTGPQVPASAWRSCIGSSPPTAARSDSRRRREVVSPSPSICRSHGRARHSSSRAACAAGPRSAEFLRNSISMTGRSGPALSGGA